MQRGAKSKYVLKKEESEKSRKEIGLGKYWKELSLEMYRGNELIGELEINLDKVRNPPHLYSTVNWMRPMPEVGSMDFFRRSMPKNTQKRTPAIALVISALRWAKKQGITRVRLAPETKLNDAGKNFFEGLISRGIIERTPDGCLEIGKIPNSITRKHQKRKRPGRYKPPKNRARPRVRSFNMPK